MLKVHKKLERLMLFSEVAQTLSFTLAANNLGISRGHLSTQIKQLEKDMGLPLLIRSTRNVRLTATGERVMQGMDKIQLSVLELERSAEHEGHAIDGLINLTAPNQFTQRFLLDICAEFKHLHPGIKFTIDSSSTQYDLNRCHYELAFRATELPPENMVAKPILTYRHCCVASPRYIEQFGIPFVPEDIIQHQCLRSQNQDYWQFDHQQVSAEGWLQVNDNNMLKHQALSGQGLIRVPLYLVDKEIAEGTLIQVLEPYMQRERKIYMVYPPSLHHSKRVSAFIHFIRAKFA
ncbi:LysR family transcriptional regulator [Flavobacterium sp. W21_SRS_FM6]|uniref:LysR family transcriptional regulator n=1 Tax=Flavobacterium sp. W21_SRS_FM6 TaxID=3240268 RepID=UPI003F8F156B